MLKTERGQSTATVSYLTLDGWGNHVFCCGGTHNTIVGGVLCGVTGTVIRSILHWRGVVGCGQLGWGPDRE